MQKRHVHPQTSAGNLAFSLAVFPTAVWARDGDGLGSLAAAAAIGLMLAIVITTLLPIKRTSLKLLSFFPVAAGCILLSIPLAALLSAAGTGASNADYRARTAAYDADPIAQAACAGDVARVKALTSGAVSEVQQKRFGEILMRCAFGNEAAHKEIFAHLMPKLSSMQHGTRRKDGVQLALGYCEVLQIVHQHRRKDLMQTLLDAKLPINCTTRDGRPAWWSGLDYPGYLSLASVTTASVTATAATGEWLSYLQNNGVPFGAKGGKNEYGVRDDRTLIDFVISSGNFEMVMMGLNAGVDTNLYARPAHHQNSPIEFWTVRRFKDNNGLTEVQVAEIQARFGELTVEQANGGNGAKGQTLLWGLEALQNNADGGAAFFAFLVSRGVNLGGRDGLGRSPLFLLRSTSPLLLAELDRLSPEQFKALTSPMDGPNSLLEAAQLMNNSTLVKYLCGKGAKCG